MSCRRPTAVAVDGKCVACFIGLAMYLGEAIKLSPLPEVHPDHGEFYWSKRGLELMAKYGIKPEDVRIVDLEEV